MADGFHPPLEEYLGTIYELEEEGVATIQARLVDRLGHTAPTVSETIGRLRADGYIRASGPPLQLTAKGRAVAESVVRKHRLAERLLADIIGLEWHKTHMEAGRWEHVISDEVEERLVIVLNNPTTCPHGNPIPGTAAPPRTLRRLSSVEPGERVTLERVTETVEVDLRTLTYLDDHGLRPGASAHVHTKAPDGTITVETDSGTCAVGAPLAELLYVTGP